MKIETRKAYAVSIDGEQQLFDDPETAVAAVHAALAVASVDPDNFSGRITWDIEDVPATPFDELLDEYIHELHDEGGIDGVERGDPFLLVEENMRGGYWLSTGMDPTELATSHMNQEYAEEWELIGIFNTATGEAVHGEVSTTVVY